MAGLVLAEVGSCPGLQLLFVGYGKAKDVALSFQLQTLGLCVPPAPLLTHKQTALYPIVLSAGAVPLLWRS